MGKIAQIYDKRCYAECPYCGSTLWLIEMENPEENLDDLNQIVALQCAECLERFEYGYEPEIILEKGDEDA